MWVFTVPVTKQYVYAVLVSVSYGKYSNAGYCQARQHYNKMRFVSSYMPELSYNFCMSGLTYLQSMHGKFNSRRSCSPYYDQKN